MAINTSKSTMKFSWSCLTSFRNISFLMWQINDTSKLWLKYLTLSDVLAHLLDQQTHSDVRRIFYEKKKNIDRLTYYIPCWVYIAFHNTFLLEQGKRRGRTNTPESALIIKNNSHPNFQKYEIFNLSDMLSCWVWHIEVIWNL